MKKKLAAGIAATTLLFTGVGVVAAPAAEARCFVPWLGWIYAPIC